MKDSDANSTLAFTILLTNMNTQVKLSSGFKKQTTKAIVAIVFFIISFVAILLLAVALTVACIYGGIALVSVHPSFVTLALGLGLASLGILVLIFLLRFIFKSNKVDRSHLHKITAHEHPRLFALIDSIVKEVGTAFPKNVYLSADVNAAVFYNSSFWSMFTPNKKNLQIGLGLINTVTEQELKAILAHEFGHFSQKTMRVGSYVYNVNQIIFNIVFDDGSYSNMAQSWANISGFIGIFVLLANSVTRGIQWILKGLYDVVNKSYLALSREMEFHADEIAASVTGYEPLKNSLLRLGIAEHSFNVTVGFYEGKITDNKNTKNIYKDHAFTLAYLGEYNGLQSKNGLPEVSLGQLNKFNKSKLVIKDQWASHPSLEDRISMLEKTGMSAKLITQNRANSFLNDLENVQEDLTTLLFKEVKYTGEVEHMSHSDYQVEYVKDFIANTFDKVYNSYYDNRNPIITDFSTNQQQEPQPLSTLFSDEIVDLVYTSVSLQNDIDTLKLIADKTINIKTLDYDGKKYTRKKIKVLLPRLEKDLKETNDLLNVHDTVIFRHFERLEKRSGKPTHLQNLYSNFVNHDAQFDSKFELYNKLSKALSFIQETTPFDQIRANFTSVKAMEITLKNEIKALLDNPEYDTEITQAVRENFKLYTSKDWQYFGTETYFEKNLGMLFEALNNYMFLLSRGYFMKKKSLLGYQAKLLKTA